MKGGFIMREKTVKLSEKQYQILSGMLKGSRQRAQTIEGLIDILNEAFKEDKYMLFDAMTNPSALQLTRKKK